MLYVDLKETQVKLGNVGVNVLHRLYVIQLIFWMWIVLKIMSVKQEGLLILFIFFHIAEEFEGYSKIWDKIFPCIWQSENYFQNPDTKWLLLL